MDGTIEFIGRNDDQVKILGHRIEPQEIENALLEYPEMISCAVVVKEMEGDNRLFAFVVMKEDVSVAEIRSFLATKLPEYMIPGYYEKMNVLPLLQSGKVDRKSLSLLAPGFLLAPTGYEEPRTTLEYELADVWKSVLRVKQIGVKDNFFDLGGDSLRAILLLNRIKRTYEVSIHLKDFFETPTVEALSSEVDKIRWLKKDVDMENELII
jgi:aryl carrier-like protein